MVPGSFCVHPPGEVHEYINGPQRSLLFRVRHGTDMLTRHVEWRGNPDFKQSAEDADVLPQESAALSANRDKLRRLFPQCPNEMQYLPLGSL